MNSALLLVFSSLLLGAEPADAVDSPSKAIDTIVVCPEPFLGTMQPWFDHRTNQGHQLGIITNTQSKQSIKAAIQEVAQQKALKFILLVGDVDSVVNKTDLTAIGTGLIQPASVPTHIEEAIVNVKFGSEPHFSSDNWYADLDEDQIPDVSIGRLSVKTPEQLKVVVNKILKYENDTTIGLHHRKINLIAGVGGFGRAADSMMEMITKKFLSEEVPPQFQTSVAYGSWQSPFCPDPREFGDETIRQLNSGALFWIYIGHGQRQYLDYVQVPGSYYPIMSVRDIARLKCETLPPIAIFLSCYTGAFDEKNDCIAELMLRKEGGPVAVFSGTRVTMPYAMSVMATEMLDEYFDKEQPTLGELILHSKRAMIQSRDSSGNRKLLDTLARLVSPSPDLLDEERLEHAQLFNLLGDPLLRLPRPENIAVQTAKQATSGSEIEVSGTAPIAGKCTIELICGRDKFTFKPKIRSEYDSSEAVLTSFNQTYRKANDQRWNTNQLAVTQGKFTSQLAIPEQCKGKCHIRVFIEGQKQCAAGSCEINIQAKKVIENE